MVNPDLIIGFTLKTLDMIVNGVRLVGMEDKLMIKVQGARYKRNVTIVPSYFVDGLHVEFWPVSDVPGYSHRVLVAGKSSGWLGTHSAPSAKTAVYFYEKRAQEEVAA